VAASCSRDIKALLQLPGIGRYTAGAGASFAFESASSYPGCECQPGRGLDCLNLEIPIDREPGKIHSLGAGLIGSLRVRNLAYSTQRSWELERAGLYSARSPM